MNSDISFLKIGFGKRFIARLIDFAFIWIIAIPLLFWFTTMKKGSSSRDFISPLFFYLWSFTLILSFVLFMIVIPVMFNGSSIGMKLIRIKIMPEKGQSLSKAILIREICFAFTWIFIIALFIIVINHTLIHKSSMLKKDDKFSSWDETRFYIITSLASLSSFVQMFLCITIIPDKNKQGLHDKAARAYVVHTRKQKLITYSNVNNDKIISLKVDIPKIEWENNEQ